MERRRLAAGHPPRRPRKRQAAGDRPERSRRAAGPSRALTPRIAYCRYSGGQIDVAITIGPRVVGVEPERVVVTDRGRPPLPVAVGPRRRSRARQRCPPGRRSPRRSECPRSLSPRCLSKPCRGDVGAATERRKDPRAFALPMQVGVDDIADAAVQLVGVEGDELGGGRRVHAGHGRLPGRGVALGEGQNTAAQAASRAADNAMCMLATRCWAAWNDAMGRPNCWRITVWSTVRCSAASPTPTRSSDSSAIDALASQCNRSVETPSKTATPSRVTPSKCRRAAA